MVVSRRRLLAAAGVLAGAAVVGVGGTLVAWWDQDPAAPLAHLSPAEVGFLDALAEAIFPAGGDPALGGREAGVSRYVDQLLAGMHPTQRKLVRVAMHALDAAPLATDAARFAALDPERARAVLAGWLGHDLVELRGVAQSLYVFVAMAYMAHPRVAPTVAPSFLCGYGT